MTGIKYTLHHCPVNLFLLGVTKSAWNDPKTSQADLAWLVLQVKGYWLCLACTFKKRALAWFWLGIWSGNSLWLYIMTFQPRHQNKTCSESLKLIVLWNLITIYKFFLSFGNWLGLTCNIILVFDLGLAWLFFRNQEAWLGLVWLLLVWLWLVVKKPDLVPLVFSQIWPFS